MPAGLLMDETGFAGAACRAGSTLSSAAVFQDKTVRVPLRCREALASADKLNKA
ncbi:hypothetical protein QO005_000336 [Rhizobium paknamense]|uniref:Uncharacterized protein n=1 Tax=Rhizobium paknamense TaxID=1206817 RepID=A0ABU0I723_9HYPH|nr:hypothetical protein [Rhizobium paknamense]